MKILLIGEFSGVHNNLKKGLTALGHEVVLAADGDGYRGFPSDIQITKYKGRIIGKILNMFRFIFKIKSFIGYDVVQIINPFSIPYYYHYFFITHLLFKYNKKKVYYVCGTDPAFIKSKESFNYFPFDDEESSDYPKYNNVKIRYYNWFIKHIDLIIPSMYSYYIGYKNNPKITIPVPLPNSEISVNSINPVGDKVKILFGITRKDFKGAKFISESIEKISHEYSHRVEFTIVEKMPFSEYYALLSKFDVLIDQCKSYDYGMNAIFAMSNGLIVLSGAEEIAKNYLQMENCPVLNIIPNTVNVINTLSELIIKSDDEINCLKKAHLNFVNEFHNYLNIAKLFIFQYEF